MKEMLENTMKNTLREMIKQTKGKFFTITFIKLDGTERTIKNGRIEVKKGLVGGINTTAHIDKYIKVYDMVDHGYKNVNLETVKYFKCGNTIWESQ